MPESPVTVAYNPDIPPETFDLIVVDEAHRIKLHDLRHFYASGLIAAGCDVVTVQRSLGHSEATTTLNTYAHLWPTAEDRTCKAAESIMTASLAAEPVLDVVDEPGGR